MRRNGKYISISEYCKANGLKPTKFYEALSRHPELAKKLKTNAKGERVLDEKAITARAISPISSPDSAFL